MEKTTAQEVRKSCKFVGGVLVLKLLLALAGCDNGTSGYSNGNGNGSNGGSGNGSYQNGGNGSGGNGNQGGQPETQAQREQRARQEIMALPNACMTTCNHTAAAQGAGFVPGTDSFVSELKMRKLNCFFVNAYATQSHMNWAVTGSIAGTTCNTGIASFSLSQTNTREMANQNAQRNIDSSATIVQASPNSITDFTMSAKEPGFIGF